MVDPVAPSSPPLGSTNPIFVPIITHHMITREKVGTHNLNPKYILTIAIVDEPIETTCLS